jgi:hypothetical protein
VAISLTPGKPMFRIVNDAVLKYIVQAPEAYAGQVVRDQEVVFTVDAFPGQPFTGRVFLISPQVNTGTRAFAFGALVPNADRKLKASTFARVTHFGTQRAPDRHSGRSPHRVVRSFPRVRDRERRRQTGGRTTRRIQRNPAGGARRIEARTAGGHQRSIAARGGATG